MKIETTKLVNGVHMPYVGLGTSPVKGKELELAIASALKAGYRSIDTAEVYDNEEDVMRGIKASGVKRADIFITSKVDNHSQGYDKTLKAFEGSLKRLDTDYIDLYLIHWPGKELFVDTWNALEKLYNEKRVRAIGVSNFLPHHLDVLFQKCTIMPMVNQFETHIYYMDIETIEYCRQRSIQVEAYAPLAAPAALGTSLTTEKILIDIGRKHGKTAAQVALRFLVQNKIVVIPKSVKLDRQIQNADLFDFELNTEEIAAIKTLNTHKRLALDPNIFFG